MYDHILGRVERPVRYIGQEWNQIIKPARPGRARVALAFPDTYEIGMSHLGMRILYDLLNQDDAIAAERVFCPWTDMERELRHAGLPLATLETRTPLRDLDVVGFSLQYEMEYSNVLTMLDLGGIPLHAEARADADPLVIAGGPCAFSPEPMADFIDAFVIGDGEETFPAIVHRWRELRERGAGRRERLQALARIDGVYVPALYTTRLDPETGLQVVAGPRPGTDAPFPVRRAVVHDLERYPFPTDTLVPYGEIVHDRVSIEIARGCTEGCRFCQAGILYRPVRERRPESILRAAAESLRRTGYDEVSLTSLSTADYSCVTSLVKTLMDRFEPQRTALSVSSMRVYGLTRTIAEQLARVRRTGFTIAPEAGTQRMRDLINKGITEADIEMAARIAWGQGWNQLKMYFMIGLPSETDADVQGIAATGIRVLELARTMKHKRAHVTISVSALVPKPHSTFQWEPMDDPETLRAKQRAILDTVRPYRKIRFKYHDVEEGVIECIVSRGDRRVGRAIEHAWRDGARFDSWTDHFDYERWMTAFAAAGVDPDLYLRRIPLHAPLPWDHLDTHVKKEFLIRDLHKGMKEKFMPACEKPFIPRDPKRTVKPLEHARLVCYDCGLDCDLEAIKHERIAARDSLKDTAAVAAAFGETPPADTPNVRVRLAPAATPAPSGRASNAFEAASGTLHGETAAAAATPRAPVPVPERGRPDDGPRPFYRVRFQKLGDLRWLSHLDLMRALHRAFQRAEIPVAYTRGYHPQPAMSFGPALPVGIEGFAELFDFEATTTLDPAAAVARLNAALPPLLRVLDVQPLPPGARSLAKRLRRAVYRAWPDPAMRAGRGAAAPLPAGALTARIDVLLARSVVHVQRHRHKSGTTQEVDIRPYLVGCEPDPEGPEGSVRFELDLGGGGQARPREVVATLFGESADAYRIARLRLYDPSQPDALPEPEPVPS